MDEVVVFKERSERFDKLFENKVVSNSINEVYVALAIY